jgi:predicted metal-dependent enzyme (double-stranded beta helix superfamily)
MATKPKFNPQKKPLKKITILNVKRTEQQSLLTEHFYPVLGIFFVALSGVLLTFGYHLDEAVVVALWVTGILFVTRQVWRFFKRDQDMPKRQKKSEKPKEPMASLPKDYKPPDVPRVSKDFSPMPPAGDKRYPPPSPFIKPPK